MYWTDTGTRKIQRANLNGTNVEDVVIGLGSPRGIALDVLRRKMYWIDSRTDKIQRANLNGTNVKDLVTNIDIGASGLALDVSGGKMYWADNHQNKVYRANLNGTRIEQLYSGGYRHRHCACCQVECRGERCPFGSEYKLRTATFF